MANKERFPAKEFDKLYKTKLSTKWKLPSGTTEHTLGDKITKFNGINWVREYKKTNALYKKLCQLNPKLKDIVVKDEDAVFDLCAGVISRFNYDDLKFYVEKWSRKKRFTENAIVSHFKGVKDKIYNDVFWIPSPETLAKLKQL
jgi:hypothetical protein